MNISLKFNSVPLAVIYEHQPYEAPSKDNEYPGCPEETKVEQVFVGDIDITPMLSEDTIEALQKQIINNIKSN